MLFSSLLFSGSHQISVCLSASEQLVIHDDWTFTLSAFLHRVTVVVVTATGDGHIVTVHVEAYFR